MSFKNLLDSCIFNMKAVVEDEKLQGKINNKDKQKILDKCGIVSWLDKDQNAGKKEFEQKEFELFIRRKSWKNVSIPIIIKLYQISGGMPGGIPGGFLDGGVSPPSDAFSRPTIVEV